MTVEEDHNLEEFEKRLEDLNKQPKYKESYTQRLIAFCDLASYKPQRFTLLSCIEEEIRCHLTWQMWDRLMWIISFGSEEELSKHIVKANEFMGNRHMTVIFMADQVPFWVKIGGMRNLYKKWEQHTLVAKRFRKGEP